MARQKQPIRRVVRRLRCNVPGKKLQPAWYRAGIAEGFEVLALYWHKHGLPPVRLRKVTWLEVVHR